MKRRKAMVVSICGIAAVTTLVIGLFSLQGCGYGREMIALASRDTDVSNYFGEEANPISFRKEILIPVSSGKDLDKNEDFIEVWKGVNKTGWVYYVINVPTIRRSGYQRIGQKYIAAPGPIIEIKNIDTSGASTSLIDGRELK